MSYRSDFHEVRKSVRRIFITSSISQPLSLEAFNASKEKLMNEKLLRKRVLE